MSETERLPRPPASEGSRSPEQNFVPKNSNLGPAFSLHNSPAEPMRENNPDVPLDSARRGSSGTGRPSKVTAHEGDDLPGAAQSSLRSGAHVRRMGPDVDGDELLDLFSVLGLDEDEKWDAPGGADDSGVAFPEPNASESHSTSGRVRRKRGDTIRASDFAKVPASASFDGSSSGLAGSARVPPRRTRSGTVTQGTNSVSGRRKHEGWPTIKMRTTEEPLRLDGDEADDELLLKDGDVVD
ncbi:hypothetical protein C8Q79DRAFT_918562 [Trametes meyenii]|nr:hypothetical protein C8Q79DRAFT_918562 [Trametes meyenii]